MLRKVLYALGLVALFALGIWAGRYIEARRMYAFNRLGSVLRLIEDQYVDSIQMDSIQDKAIPLILSELDPHSTYLSAEMNRRENEGLMGSFDGIGVLFNRFTDTVVVTRVLEGGASERAGIKAGDRILRADTSSLVGKELSDEAIIGKLKGPSKSVVRLLIKRDGQEEQVSVVRGPVPVSTLDAAYMVKPHTLYIRINKWGARTHQEVLTAYAKHAREQVHGIVIDLRDNSGGFMDSSLTLAGEFLKKGDLILYAEGRAFPRENYVNPKDGLLVKMPLVVLVNEFSASASEIFAGVMQDHDRATIIGRRTFGKGLVQQTFMLGDSSAVRLTVARYYTPSGRSVQKSYSAGLQSYSEDLYRRAEHGELFSADSISTADSVNYYTAAKRIVHGGGGVTPDVFIPRDTVGRNSYYLRLLASGTLPRFAFEYADKNRESLQRLDESGELVEYLSSMGNGLLFEYAYYAQRKGIPIRTTLLYESASTLLPELRAWIAEYVSRIRNSFFQLLMQDSNEVNTGVELIESGLWNPLTMPAPDENEAGV